MRSPVKSISDLLIAVLVFVAVFLGVLIYRQNFPERESEEMVQENAESNTRQVEQGTAGNINFAERRPTPTGLTADEEIIYNPPGPDATKEEMDKFIAALQEVAVDTDVVDINNCEKPSPLVIRLKNNQDFEMVNSGDEAHTVVLDNEHNYPIKAGETVEMKADFGRGSGYYGYLCDNLGGVVGFFLVEP